MALLTCYLQLLVASYCLSTAASVDLGTISEPTPVPISEDLSSKFEGSPESMFWQDLDVGNAPAAAQVIKNNIAHAVSGLSARSCGVCCIVSQNASSKLQVIAYSSDTLLYVTC